MPSWCFLCHISLLCGCLVPSPSVLEEWSFPEQLSWSWVVFSLVECNLCRNNLGSYFQVSTLTFAVLLSSTPSPLSEGHCPAPGSMAPGLLLCLVFCSYREVMVAYFLGAPVLLFQGSLWASDHSDVPVAGWSFCHSYFLLASLQQDFCLMNIKWLKEDISTVWWIHYSHTKFLQ